MKMENMKMENMKKNTTRILNLKNLILDSGFWNLDTIHLKKCFWPEVKENVTRATGCLGSVSHSKRRHFRRGSGRWVRGSRGAAAATAARRGASSARRRKLRSSALLHASPPSAQPRVQEPASPTSERRTRGA